MNNLSTGLHLCMRASVETGLAISLATGNDFCQFLFSFKRKKIGRSHLFSKETTRHNQKRTTNLLSLDLRTLNWVVDLEYLNI